MYFEAVFSDFSVFFITKRINGNGRTLIRRDKTTLISLGNGLPRDLRSLAMTADERGKAGDGERFSNFTLKNLVKNVKNSNPLRRKGFGIRKTKWKFNFFCKKQILETDCRALKSSQ